MAREKLDSYVPAMLARETDKAFSDKDWIFEMKWDGFRAIAEVNNKKVRLYSRNGNSFLESYPPVRDALKQLGINAVLDGEIIVVEDDGRSNFQKLQYYGTDARQKLEYRVFDLLRVGGRSLMHLPLLERKARLKKLLPENDVVKYSDHIETYGEAFFKKAQDMDLEGIMAKKADSLYYPGERTTEWLKIKHHKTAEVIVAGFTEPTGSRSHFGSLVLGIYDGSRLKYVGHTGTGFNYNSLAEINKKLKPLITQVSPFKEAVKTNKRPTWVKPVLVAEIKFTEWTRDGSLRHPVFLRLRKDKKAKDITMATQRPIKKEAVRSARKPEKKAVAKKDSKKKRLAKKGVPGKEKEIKLKKNEAFISFGRIKVKVSNLDKIYFPDEKVTKGDVINYYISISKFILPYLKGRPESLKRNPNGIKDYGFFHKDAADEAPDWVKGISLYSESAKKTVDYILCENQATLTYLNNLGCIEINPWHSTVKDLDRPDYMMIDLDPSDKNTFDQVIEAANVTHDVLKRAGVESYCKTSGATGLHIFVPMAKKYEYEEVKEFAHLICTLVQEELPGFTTLERNLKKRGDKHMYLDYLQNRRGQTISSVYSVRPKPGATVSMPLKWSEVKPGLTPQKYNILNALKIIEKRSKLFAPVLGKGIDIAKALKKL